MEGERKRERERERERDRERGRERERERERGERREREEERGPVPGFIHNTRKTTCLFKLGVRAERREQLESGQLLGGLITC